MADAADLRALLSTTDQLPSLPQALLAAQQALQQQQLSLGRCATLIGQEPALAATTLRLANSAFYGAPGRVASVGDALRLLGLRTVAGLLTAAAVQQLLLQLPQQPGEAPFDIQAAWRHALHTAVAARQMALLTGLDADQAMLAGLLHDIGQLTLATVLPEHARQARLHALQHRCSALQAELAVLGLGHPQVGALLARRWHLPPASRCRWPNWWGMPMPWPMRWSTGRPHRPAPTPMRPARRTTPAGRASRHHRRAAAGRSPWG